MIGPRRILLPSVRPHRIVMIFADQDSPLPEPVPALGMTYIRASELGCALECDLKIGGHKPLAELLPTTGRLSMRRWPANAAAKPAWATWSFRTIQGTRPNFNRRCRSPYEPQGNRRCAASLIKRLYELFSPMEPSEILRCNKAQSRPA